ncbi:MAG TPA: carbonic anhydrase [Bacteroidetes bacterium]|nr:carbonic anhydrase [Bacteroidota bacterium]
MSENIKDLLQGNNKWVGETNSSRPTFFDDLSHGQAPEYLWIGCSDSRVPATQITNTVPGSIFVQRNIANMVIHTDSNLLSVVNYAVKVLKVKHIIVCGHYGCGGVLAAMSNDNFGFLDNWLMHIKDVYRLHQEELDIIKDEAARGRRFVELNIMEQVNNLARVSFIQEEWENGEYPYIHGWVYSLQDGLLQDLEITVNSIENLEKIYQYKIR